MFNDIMQIDSHYLINAIKCMGLIIFISFIWRLFRPLASCEIQIDEFLINFLKFLGYGLLAGYIYSEVLNNQVEQIDVLTFFTFLLACFEATHNFMLTIGAGFATLIRICYESIFKNERF